MSNNDSFIEEVNEELRRDRLFQAFRKYGWIAVLVVVLLVAGAAFYEWQRAQTRAKAEALGDGLLAYLTAEDDAARAAALDGIEVTGDAAALRSLMEAGVALDEGDAESAASTLEAVSVDPETGPIYRDLATLGAVMAASDTLSTDERLARLEPLTIPGAPFRLMAMEQIALTLAEAGNASSAIDMLKDIISDTEVTAGLRLRASQLIVALGGELDAG